MSCHPATDKQKKYARALAARLEREDNQSKWVKRVARTHCIEEMSRLIDQMKDELDL